MTFAKNYATMILFLIVATTSTAKEASQSSTSPRDPSNADSLQSIDKEEYLRTTGLKPGVYELIDGPKGCAEGFLEILDSGESLSLVLGGSGALIVGLGQPSMTYTNRACKSQVTTNSTQGKIYGKKVQSCTDTKSEVTFEVTLKFEGDQLSYTKTTTSKEKTENIQCKLHRLSSDR